MISRIYKIIHSLQWNRRNLSIFLLLSGIIVPFLLVTAIHQRHTDTLHFKAWAACLQAYSREIYLECEKLNPKAPKPIYTAPGLIVSSGALQLIKSYSSNFTNRNPIDIFRYYLAFFDVMNFFLFIWLAKLMRFRFPVLIGFILVIVPSSWASTSVWGQIDGISLTLCLLSTICFFKSWSPTPENDNHRILVSGLWLGFGAITFSIYLLLKHLSIFSLPFFILLIIVTIGKFWRNWKYKGLLCIGLACTLFMISFRYFDTLFEVPANFYDSSFWYTWNEWGSNQAKKIAGNGFNIWIFLITGHGFASPINMLTSSEIPFFNLELGSGKLDFTPYRVGIGLYLILNLFLLLTGFKLLRQIQRFDCHTKDNLDNYQIAILCLFFGISYLGFNVCLSGTHERYLHLGYPFLLIAAAWFYTNHIYLSRFSILFCFFAASAYGTFVLSVIRPIPGVLFPLRQHQFIGSIHLFLLLMLLQFWWQIYHNKRMFEKYKI